MEFLLRIRRAPVMYLMCAHTYTCAQNKRIDPAISNLASVALRNVCEKKLRAPIWGQRKSRAPTNIVRFEHDTFKKNRDELRLNVEAAEFKPREKPTVSMAELQAKYTSTQVKMRKQRKK